MKTKTPRKMKKSIYVLGLGSALLFAACGGKKEEKSETTPAADTSAQTAAPEESKEVVKDYAWLAAKLDKITIDGYTLTVDMTNDNADNQDIRRSWTADPATAGFDKLNITSSSLSRSGNQRKELEHKSLQEFQDFTIKNKGEKTTYEDFKEDNVNGQVFYSKLAKGMSDDLGPKNYNMIHGETFIGDLNVQYRISVYDNKADLSKAKEFAAKIQDFLSKE
jgi:hypothetical protein